MGLDDLTKLENQGMPPNPQPQVIGQIFLMPNGTFSIQCQLSAFDSIEVLLALARSFNQDLKKKYGEQKIIVPDLIVGGSPK